MMSVHADDYRPRSWREQLRDFVTEPELWVAFAIFTATAAVAYVAGYRDGADRR
jgi:hypothetical protein